MVGRSNTSDFRDGFVKLIANKKAPCLGATVMAPHAAEIMHELSLAIKHGLRPMKLPTRHMPFSAGAKQSVLRH